MCHALSCHVYVHIIQYVIVKAHVHNYFNEVVCIFPAEKLQEDCFSEENPYECSRCWYVDTHTPLAPISTKRASLNIYFVRFSVGS